MLGGEASVTIVLVSRGVPFSDREVRSLDKWARQSSWKEVEEERPIPRVKAVGRYTNPSGDVVQVVQNGNMTLTTWYQPEALGLFHTDRTCHDLLQSQVYRASRVTFDLCLPAERSNGIVAIVDLTDTGIDLEKALRWLSVHVKAIDFHSRAFSLKGQWTKVVSKRSILLAGFGPLVDATGHPISPMAFSDYNLMRSEIPAPAQVHGKTTRTLYHLKELEDRGQWGNVRRRGTRN